MSAANSRAVEDYLKAIHAMGGAEEFVSTQAIAKKLGVRAPSVTGMLKRLKTKNLIEYETRSGVRLKKAGLLEARRVVRRHRLVELFLTKILGLDWSEVDHEAEALEHSISPRLEQAIAAHLDEPLEDPHGHPIPSPEGDLKSRKLSPLTSFMTGQTVLIREVRDDNPDRLKRWKNQGLVPGAKVFFADHQPLDDLFELQVGEKTLTLGSEGLGGLLGELHQENLNN
ncbi:MAG: metal-dependent transcriptional regulator [Gemmataceae bacterium]|nr:metal-dependent transcriptional regulator [Gemmataceae bacterium]